MTIVFWILGCLVALLCGIAVGFFSGKAVMKKYLKNNPIFNPASVAMMFSEGGKKPSKKQIRKMTKILNKNK